MKSHDELVEVRFTFKVSEMSVEKFCSKEEQDLISKEENIKELLESY